MNRTTRYIVAMLSALSLTGCAWGTLTPEEFEQRYVDGVCGEFFQPDGLALTFAALADEVGRPIRSTRMVVYPDYGTFELRDAMNARHLNSWVVRGTTVESHTPLQVSVDDDLDGRTFRVADFPWSDLNDALGRGLDALNLESGTVRYLVVEPRDGVLAMRAFYGGPRETGYVDFDSELAVVRVHKN